jgi:hypothetical protein
VQSLTQNNTTATIATFLKSRYRNPVTDKLDGLALDEDGNFLHYNIIINATYNELFKDMHLVDGVSENFKKEFCKHFYNREIGLETFARFQIALEEVLNNECFNLFKYLAEIRNKTIKELNQSMNIDTVGNQKADGQALQIANTTPQERKEIVFTERYGVIEYADNLVENHQKNNADTKSNVSGWSGSSLAERLQNNAELKDIQFQIFNICDKLFLQVF